MKVGYLFNLSFVSTRFYGEFGVEIVGNNIILGLSICPLLNLVVSERRKLNEFRIKLKNDSVFHFLLVPIYM